jgi:hypothetical protein
LLRTGWGRSMLPGDLVNTCQSGPVRGARCSSILWLAACASSRDPSLRSGQRRPQTRFSLPISKLIETRALLRNIYSVCPCVFWPRPPQAVDNKRDTEIRASRNTHPAFSVILPRRSWHDGCYRCGSPEETTMRFLCPRSRLAGRAPPTCKWLRQALVAVVATGSASICATARAQIASADGGSPLCAVDSDCGSPYLACAATPLDVCRPADADTTAYPQLADAAICPAMSRGVLDICVVRYQLPCRVDSDCGPAGFTCNLDAGTLCKDGSCSTLTRCESHDTPCATNSECPAAWSCYSPIGGLQPSDASALKACYPPFAMFNGPAGAVWSPTQPVDSGSSSRMAPDMPSGNAARAGGGCDLASGRSNFSGAWLVPLGALAILARRRSVPRTAA